MQIKYLAKFSDGEAKLIKFTGRESPKRFYITEREDVFGDSYFYSDSWIPKSDSLFDSILDAIVCLIKKQQDYILSLEKQRRNAEQDEIELTNLLMDYQS
jgi:hypothetical protein